MSIKKSLQKCEYVPYYTHIFVLFNETLDFTVWFISSSKVCMFNLPPEGLLPSTWRWSVNLGLSYCETHGIQCMIWKEDTPEVIQFYLAPPLRGAVPPLLHSANTYRLLTVAQPLMRDTGHMWPCCTELTVGRGKDQKQISTNNCILWHMQRRTWQGTVAKGNRREPDLKHCSAEWHLCWDHRVA